jgi:hypothetical protein
VGVFQRCPITRLLSMEGCSWPCTCEAQDQARGKLSIGAQTGVRDFMWVENTGLSGRLEAACCDLADTYRSSRAHN